MKYAVVEKKKAKGKIYIVVDKTTDINERWIFEPYILGIEPDKKTGDIVLPYIEYLNEKYSSIIFERGSIVNTKRNCFIGLSTVSVYFTDKKEAENYAEKLNTAK